MSDDTPETFDAADPAAEANARREVARQERNDRNVMVSIMMTVQGRDWLYRKLDSCHINNTPDYGEETHRQARALGREEVGQKLMIEAMSASTDLYMEMIKEQQEEEQRLNEVRKKERQNREEREGPIDVNALVAPLPPPAGYPGGPPLPKKKEK